MPGTVCPDLRHELSLLILSRYPLVAIESLDEIKVENLVAKVASDLGLPLLIWSSSTGLIRPGAGRIAETRDPDRALSSMIEWQQEALVLFHDLQPYFDRPEIIRRLREAGTAFSTSRSAMVLCGPTVPLPAELVHHSAKLEISLPNVTELERIVRRTARELADHRRTEVELDEDQFEDLARALQGLHVQEARRVLYQAALRDRKLDMDDLPELLEGKKARVQQTGLLDWIEPLDGMSELGGTPHLKKWVGRRGEAFSSEAVRFGLEPPKGLLLVGVPGTGKSLACRALAGEWKLPLLRLDPGRLYDKFIGETEANLRRALSTCEAMSPVVLWVDEIEKALATGQGTSSDGGVSQRILGTLLTWMQEKKSPVFVMATSNDVTRLPSELLRRGRFDDIFFVDLPNREERAKIFEIHLANRERSPADFDLDALAEKSEGFAGAEIESVIVAALYHAFSERTELTDAILQDEIRSTRPLSVLRPQEIESLRQWGAAHANPA